MRIETFETWMCKRPKGLFDEEREGAAPMPWAYGVGRITTSDGAEGIATFWAARSAAVTDAYLADVIAPVILGRSIHDRERIDQPHGGITSAGLRFETDGKSVGYATDFNEFTAEMERLYTGLDRSGLLRSADFHASRSAHRSSRRR